MAAGRRWTWDELLIAQNLYRKLTFGQLHARNPVIIQVAERLQRPPGSLAMKLCNLASLDPALRARGIRGLEGASSLDRRVWKEFHDDLSEFVPRSEEAFRTLFEARPADEVDVIGTRGVRVRRNRKAEEPTEQMAAVKIRRGQQFFRQMILSAFNSQCCVTGIPVREFLVASHIMPWGEFPKERLSAENGLCLSRLHDAAFDQGFIAFDDDYRLVLSAQLKSHLPHMSVEQNFVAHAGNPIRLPVDAPIPKREFLRYHLHRIFRG
jgi:putative restriction endonuclease